MRCAQVWMACCAVLLVPSPAVAATNTAPAAPVQAPESAREFFNAGTRMLHDSKWREAEAYLQTALARQDEALQPAALYNLGHARFAQGVEDLKKAADSRQVSARARQAALRGHAAIRSADAALAGTDVDRMVDAYVQGGGARRELKSAMQAVRKAMEVHGGVLLKWQRAAGDFESAAEMDPKNSDARKNAEIVQRRIAWLIDQIREMQQALAAAAQAQQQLGERMQQLRGRIPADRMPPGAPGEGEEDEFGPDGPQLGMSEGPSKDGEEMQISPEDAARLLEQYRLDGDRRLPMGEGEEGKPRDPNKATW